ncbi:MAG: TlyA family RNA methyltransferase, partial [Candidatus Eremiobacterota bacterium]
KLEKALDEFHLEVADRVALDVGASTGGFTDCLLQRGAARVYAVDVGHGQLDLKLRRDPRVVVLEKVNARYLSHREVPEPVGFASVDVSFISLELILPTLPPLLTPTAEVVALVKPQFEAGRDQIGRGGVVRAPEVHAQVLRRVAAAAEGLGLALFGLTWSPVRGPAGNIEFLAGFRAREANYAAMNRVELYFEVAEQARAHFGT